MIKHIRKLLHSSRYEKDPSQHSRRGVENYQGRIEGEDGRQGF